MTNNSELEYVRINKALINIFETLDLRWTFRVTGARESGVITLPFHGDDSQHLSESVSDIHAVLGFTVKGPAGPVVVELGADATLPCQLSPARSAAHMHIRWYRGQLSPAVHVYQNGQEQGGEQMLEYRGRTELTRDAIGKGGVALVIQHARASDDGQYRCRFKDGDISQEATVQLNVIGLGSAPEVYMTGPEDGGIRVLCSSGGWFPKPKVQWRDMAGVKLPSLSEAQSQDGDGLFHVEASLVVRDSSLGNVTCSIENPHSGQEKVSAIFLPEPFFPRMSPWKAALAGTVPVLGLLLIGTCYIGWREHQDKQREIKKMGEKANERDETRKQKEHALQLKETLQEELKQRKALYDEDWKKALLYPDWRKEHFQHVAVSLQHENFHPNGSDAERRENSKEGAPNVTLSDKKGDGNIIIFDHEKKFVSGRYYWELDISRDADAWALGIREEHSDNLLKRYIVLEKKGCKYRGLTYGPKDYFKEEPLSIENFPQKIVVFLDYEDSDLSFYDMTEGTHIFSFTEVSFSGLLYPYFTHTKVRMKKYITALIVITCHYPIANEAYEIVENLTWGGSIHKVDNRDTMTTAALLRILVLNFILFMLLDVLGIYQSNLREEIEQMNLDTGLREENEKMKEEKAHILEEKRKLQKEIANVILDPDTAHTNLSLEEGRRCVTWKETPAERPDKPQRFYSLPCVLGQQFFTSGRFYWEVDVTASGAWDIGICRDNVMRTGRIVIKPENGFWVIRFYKNEYWALSSPETKLTPKVQPSSVCIFIDYEDGCVSFYNMKDKTHIHTFNRCSFYGSLRSLFRLWSNDSGHLKIVSTVENHTN
ncbi:butyrophilin-like protein 1 [Echinops telfairi]|uniref:Butyrophilin-like protein 1 n=1 Tax=Echinops telfairi TaxID=9371 RepID=A0ABM1VKI7_ECHTE|nr:butyrophilin-like protein 1 [Echinops telfairi]